MTNDNTYLELEDGTIAKFVRMAVVDGKACTVIQKPDFGELVYYSDVKIVEIDHALERVTQDIYERVYGYFKLGMSKQDVLKCMIGAFVKFVMEKEQ